MMKGMVRIAAAVACVVALAGFFAVTPTVLPLPPAAAEPSDDVCGQVTLRASGAPVAGAEVQLWARPADTPKPFGQSVVDEFGAAGLQDVPDLDWPAAPLRKSTTGPDGRYRIAAAPSGMRSWIVVTAPDCASAVRSVKSNTLDFKLGAAEVQSIQVMGASSSGLKPVAGANLLVFDRRAEGGPVARLKSGPDGKVRAALSENSLVMVTAPGVARDFHTMKVGPGRVGTVVLPQAATITGRVVDEAGAGLPGATVVISGWGLSVATTSSTAGEFSLIVPDDVIELFLAASAPDCAIVAMETVIGDRPPRIVLAKRRTLAGRVLTADGSPCAGCEIEVEGRLEPHRAVTGPDGRFEVSGLPAEALLVQAKHTAGEITSRAQYTVDLRPGLTQAPLELRLRPDRGSSVLRLRVLGEGGKPLAGAAVLERGLGKPVFESPAPFTCDSKGEVSIPVACAAGNSTTIGVIPAGQAMDEVQCYADVNAASAPATVLTLAALTTLRLDVRGDGGAELPRSQWTARWEPMPASPTDLQFPEARGAAGQDIRVPATVPFQLTVRAQGRAVYGARLTASEAKNGVLTVRTDPVSSARVRIEGAPAGPFPPRIEVSVRREDPGFPRPIENTFDVEGDVIALDGLGPGRWTALIAVAVPGAERISVLRRIEGLVPGPQDVPPVRWNLPAFKGSVTCNGAPLVDVRVHVVWSGQIVAGGRTDRTGRLAFTADVAPGAVLRIRKAGYATIEVPWQGTGQKLDFTMVPAAEIRIRAHRQPQNQRCMLIVRNGGREIEGTVIPWDVVWIGDLVPGPVEIIEYDGSFRRVTRGEAVLGKITEFDLPPR